jgi:salicylate hydroxylase
VQNGTDWFIWMDGSQEDEALVHKMYLGERGFEGCARADFLDELVKSLPPDTVKFSKNLVEISDADGLDEVELKFSDGSTTSTNVGMSYSQIPASLPIESYLLIISIGW